MKSSGGDEHHRAKPIKHALRLDRGAKYEGLTIY
jgi:hypothetical protein